MKEYQEVWGCNYGVFFILDKSDYFRNLWVVTFINVGKKSEKYW